MPGHYDNNDHVDTTTDLVGKAATTAAVVGGATYYMNPGDVTPSLNGLVGRFLPGGMPIWQTAAVAGAATSVFTDVAHDTLLPWVEKEIHMQNPGALTQRAMSAGLGATGAYYLLDPRFLDSSIGRGAMTIIGYGAAGEVVAGMLWPSVKQMVFTPMI